MADASGNRDEHRVPLVFGDALDGKRYVMRFRSYCCGCFDKYKNIISYNPICIRSFREVLPVKKEAYVLETVEQPGIDKLDCKDFKINFQRAILRSLLGSRKLTQAQFEACMDKVVQKYSAGLS